MQVKFLATLAGAAGLLAFASAMPVQAAPLFTVTGQLTGDPPCEHHKHRAVDKDIGNHCPLIHDDGVDPRLRGRLVAIVVSC